MQTYARTPRTFTPSVVGVGGTAGNFALLGGNGCASSTGLSAVICWTYTTRTANRVERTAQTA